jgi:hypothetical protein
MPVASGLTLGSDEQSCPHEPQFAGSVSKLTQLPAQTSGVGILQESVHCIPVEVLEQSGVGGEHSMVHPPQLIGPVRLVSQPSSGCEEQ